MVDKKGFIKIVEASIAILLIFAVIIILVGRNNIKKSENLSKAIPPILEEIALNNSLRKLVLDYDVSKGEDYSTNSEIITKLEYFVKNRIRPGIKYKVRICKVDDLCLLEETEIPDKEVYADERIISTALGGDPNKEYRKAKVFLWRND